MKKKLFLIVISLLAIHSCQAEEKGFFSRITETISWIWNSFTSLFTGEPKPEQAPAAPEAQEPAPSSCPLAATTQPQKELDELLQDLEKDLAKGETEIQSVTPAPEITSTQEIMPQPITMEEKSKEVSSQALPPAIEAVSTPETEPSMAAVTIAPMQEPAKKVETSISDDQQLADALLKELELESAKPSQEIPEEPVLKSLENEQMPEMPMQDAAANGGMTDEEIEQLLKELETNAQ